MKIVKIFVTVIIAIAVVEIGKAFSTPLESSLKNNEEFNEQIVEVDELDQSEEAIISDDNFSSVSNSKSNNVEVETKNDNSTKNSEVKENTNTNQKEETTTEVVENKKEESQEKNTEIHYIGVPNPNDFYYSFHHGQIDYKTVDSCVDASYEVLYKDTSDITNAWCIDVVDEEGTVLGEYLYIKCNSGNCDKYK